MAGAGHVQTFIYSLLRDGAEGAIFRRLSSFYDHGRSLNLIKLKVLSLFIFYYVLVLMFLFKTVDSDQEGIIVSIDDSGSVEVQLYVFIINYKKAF